MDEEPGAPAGNAEMEQLHAGGTEAVPAAGKQPVTIGDRAEYSASRLGPLRCTDARSYAYAMAADQPPPAADDSQHGQSEATAPVSEAAPVDAAMATVSFPPPPDVAPTADGMSAEASAAGTGTPAPEQPQQNGGSTEAGPEGAAGATGDGQPTRRRRRGWGPPVMDAPTATPAADGGAAAGEGAAAGGGSTPTPPPEGAGGEGGDADGERRRKRRSRWAVGVVMGADRGTACAWIMGFEPGLARACGKCMVQGMAERLAVVSGRHPAGSPEVAVCRRRVCNGYLLGRRL